MPSSAWSTTRASARTPGADAWSAQHINAPDQCARLIERCSEVYGHGPTIVSEIGPVLSAHTGPGLLGMGALPATSWTS